MQNQLRTYIESQPQELIDLQDLATKSGMKVFVEVNENFPRNFIDTIPFLASICERFKVSTADLKPISEEFFSNGRNLLARLSAFRPSNYPHEVTTSFLLTAVIANKHRNELEVEDLQSYGWHADAARIVLGHGG